MLNVEKKDEALKIQQFAIQNQIKARKQPKYWWNVSPLQFR